MSEISASGKENRTECKCFQYRPYRKGARKEPARAPQDTPIICAIMEKLKVSLSIAMTVDTTMKNTTKMRTVRSFFLSLISLREAGAITSRVRVEAEVSTRLDRVDMEADSTSTITTAISAAGREDSI